MNDDYSALPMILTVLGIAALATAIIVAVWA